MDLASPWTLFQSLKLRTTMRFSPLARCICFKTLFQIWNLCGGLNCNMLAPTTSSIYKSNEISKSLVFMQILPIHHFFADTLRQLWNPKARFDYNLSIYLEYIVQPLSNIVSLPVIYCAFYYIHRLSLLSPQGKAPKSEYRIFLIALILADIHTNDNPFSISVWSQLSRFSCAEIIQMRREFLKLLNYNLNISPEELTIFVKKIHLMYQLNSFNDLFGNKNIITPVHQSTYPDHQFNLSADNIQQPTLFQC